MGKSSAFLALLVCLGGCDDGGEGDASDTPDAAGGSIDGGGDVVDAGAPDAEVCEVAGTGVAARIVLTGDDRTKMWVNGQLVDETEQSWSSPRSYDRLLHSHPIYPNVIAVAGINLFNTSGHDRGIVVDVRSEAGAPLLVSDARWKVSGQLVAGWETDDFDDSTWSAPFVIGEVGVAPWGEVLENMAPGSTASWLWFYDASIAVDKPAEETMYARRIFWITPELEVVDAPFECPAR